MQCAMGSLTAVVLWTILQILLCDAKPFRNMSDNVAHNISQASSLADNRSSNEPGALLAVHQDLHPVLLPAPSQPVSNRSIPQPIATDAEMHKALALHPVDIPLGHSNITLTPSPINPNATKLEQLMDKIKQPLPDPNSNQIQPKGPTIPHLSPTPRDLLPSIVAQSNKEVSTNPVEGSGVPPSAIAQAKGELPKQMVQNPFGDTPAVIPVGQPLA